MIRCDLDSNQSFIEVSKINIFEEQSKLYFFLTNLDNCQFRYRLLFILILHCKCHAHWNMPLKQHFMGQDRIKRALSSIT